MHRFFVEDRVPGIDVTITLSKEESLHAARVLRLKAGETVQILDNENLYQGELLQLEEQAVIVRILEKLPSPEPPAQVTLLQGLPKGDKLEMIVQKATELGAFAIAPVEMSRSIAKADRQSKKQERYQRIALEAAKQSGRAHVPEIHPPQSFSALCKALANAAEPPYDAVLIAWEEEQAMPLSRAIRSLRQAHADSLNGHRIALLIGPEGGISIEECEQLKVIGAQSVTLGPRILRTETAGICALSVIWAALDEM